MVAVKCRDSDILWNPLKMPQIREKLGKNKIAFQGISAYNKKAIL